MPVKRLPENPSLVHLKYQAKDLLKEHAAQDPQAGQRIREFHPAFQKAADRDIFAARLSLSDAQLTIAREHGFPSWPRLKRHIERPTLADKLQLPHHERIEDARFRRAVELLDAGDVAGLGAYLAQNPELSRQHVVFEGGNYFGNPTLLEFAAENPVRRGKLPKNIVEVARTVIAAGADQAALDGTLMLVATGMVPRQCGVQAALIDLLCDHGARPDAASQPAALHGEFKALHALLGRGAKLDLPIAAALGRTEDAGRLLPQSSGLDRHLALSLAADHGHVEIVRMLLDTGEDPNRYNPPGGHSHTTPLHQAAGAGHEAVVRLLVERGARLDMKDILWQGTPAGWAEYGGKNEIAAYLREEEAKRGQGPHVRRDIIV